MKSKMKKNLSKKLCLVTGAMDSQVDLSVENLIREIPFIALARPN